VTNAFFFIRSLLADWYSITYIIPFFSAYGNINKDNYEFHMRYYAKGNYSIDPYEKYPACGSIQDRVVNERSLK